MNTTLYNNLIDRYNKISYTHNYIFGFTYKGNVYACKSSSEVLPYILTLDKASRGAGYAIRFKPNTSQKLFLLKSSEVICSVKYFEEMTADSKYNRGEIFEKIITENAGQVWTKDNLKFTEAPDVEIEGIGYQVKFEKATFTNEKSLSSLEKKA